MKSDIISDITVKLMKQIDSGNIQISDSYINLIIKMHLFFKELIGFAIKISKNNLNKNININIIINIFII
jgi:hypothetical protein